MYIKQLHNWSLSYTDAIALQKRLACEVNFSKLPKKIRTIAGLDCAICKDGKKIAACVVVMRFAGLEIIETASCIQKLEFPYIPGLLSFREAPVCLAAVEKLKTLPDVFIVDGQGICHPRRLGIASHLGLFLDKPTIGCAKSRLIGEYEPVPIEKGGYSLLTDKQQVLGAVLRTRNNVKPVFVSVGHKCTLEDAIKIVLACTTKYRLPEPARLAHQLVGTLKITD